MNNTEKDYILIFGRNKFERLNIILWCLIRNRRLIILGTNFSSSLTSIPWIKRYINKNAEVHKICLEDYKGLIYEIHVETVDLATKFYNKIIRNDNKIVTYYNRILNTSKFEAYIKREISDHIFILLKAFHLIRLSDLKENMILVSKNPINKFLIQYMEEKYGVKYKIKKVSSPLEIFILCAYYGWLFIEFIKRGFVFNKDRKGYKISHEATLGFYQKTLKDDLVIDGIRFKKNDMLLLEFNNQNCGHVNTLEQVKKEGFDLASVPGLRININKNIFNVLFFYFIVPLRIYFQLLLSKELYLFYYIFLFHRRCFPVEILMNSYRLKCNISSVNYDDNVTTIILNKYGAKNVIYNWSDLAVFKGYSFAFCAHNVYFTWGDIHHDFHSAYTFIDKKINIGCIFKKEYNKAVYNKERIIGEKLNIKKSGKIVTFFDNTFDESLHLTPRFFIKYLKIVEEFCISNKSISVLLKPKGGREAVLTSLGRDVGQYIKIWDNLLSFNNFIYLNPLEFCFEEALAVSDACVSMGLNSPSMVALICGKNALYFDDTGNRYHPFANKYKDILVFEDKNLLFRQLNNILDGKFNCGDVVGEKTLREYDAFVDDNAAERMINYLYELTGGGN